MRHRSPRAIASHNNLPPTPIFTAAAAAARADDDTQFPNQYCLAGDGRTCASKAYAGTAYAAVCSDACAEGWGVPCGWEAIASLPQACAGTFVPTVPSASMSSAADASSEASPVVTHPLTIQSGRLQNTTYWACNVHAFCLSCVDGGVVNPYCKAAVWKTKTLYAPSVVLSDNSDRNLGYWCEDDVISSIEQGAFANCKEGVFPGMDCSTPRSLR